MSEHNQGRAFAAVIAISAAVADEVPSLSCVFYVLCCLGVGVALGALEALQKRLGVKSTTGETLTTF
jgi:hypothetical protein